MAMKRFSFSTLSKVLIIAALLLASACNLQGAPAGITDAPGDQAAPQAYVIQTLVAQGVAQTVAAMGTRAPEHTFTPSLTPSSTLTPTLESVRVSVSVETNCRSGPGSAFDKVGVLPVGVAAEVVGRSMVNDNWIIKLPSDPDIT